MDNENRNPRKDLTRISLRHPYYKFILPIPNKDQMGAGTACHPNTVYKCIKSVWKCVCLLRAIGRGAEHCSLVDNEPHVACPSYTYPLAQAQCPEEQTAPDAGHCADAVHDTVPRSAGGAVRKRIDPSHKSHNALHQCPTMHHFVTEIYAHVNISDTRWCIAEYEIGALWNSCNIQASMLTWHVCRMILVAI